MVTSDRIEAKNRLRSRKQLFIRLAENGREEPKAVISFSCSTLAQHENFRSCSGHSAAKRRCLQPLVYPAARIVLANQRSWTKQPFVAVSSMEVFSRPPRWSNSPSNLKKFGGGRTQDFMKPPRAPFFNFAGLLVTYYVALKQRGHS